MKSILAQVEENEAGLRLDCYLAERDTTVSRSEFQRTIRAGRVSVNGRIVKQPAYHLHPGEVVHCALHPKSILEPAKLDIPILYEDDHFVVVNKPAGLVVHPGAGHKEPTLVEALLFDRSLPRGTEPMRPGIVHRLDKETSGAIVVTKTMSAMISLRRQFATSKVEKTYLAVVEGKIVEEEGLIDAPVGRDPSHPTRMTVHPTGRSATTTFEVLTRSADETLLLVFPRTGRTHQIRVHCHYTGHPIVGDALYGHRKRRLMLHAWRLAFFHPATDKWVRFEAPIPPDFPDYPYDEIPWREDPHTDNQSQQDN